MPFLLDNSFGNLLLSLYNWTPPHLRLTPNMSVLPAADDPPSDGDSDASSDASAYGAHYHPISADADSDDGESVSLVHSNGRSNGGDFARRSPPNPSFLCDRVENGVSRLDLNGHGMQAGELREEEEEDDEEAAAAAEREMEASISRAFSEDESRRSAPLTRENAATVMEAMRGVSFPGCPPDWVGQVPEDRWVDHLRRLRSGDSSSAPPS